MGDYVRINATRVDANSPVDEDLTGDIKTDLDYLQESALRCGTDTTRVRLCFARGRDAFSTSASVPVVLSGTVTFSSDATDGDPNFASTPMIVMSLEETTTNWATEVNGACGPYVQDSSASATGFTWEMKLDKDSAATVDGFVTWTAIGTVTADE